MNRRLDISVFKGLSFKEILGGDEELTFYTTDGRVFAMYHAQDCCERVYLEDINGDIEDLLNTPILKAHESTSDDDPPENEWVDEVQQWTFYHLSTIKGSVVLRWFGSSNGYYSTDVSIREEK